MKLEEKSCEKVSLRSNDERTKAGETKGGGKTKEEAKPKDAKPNESSNLKIKNLLCYLLP